MGQEQSDEYETSAAPQERPNEIDWKKRYDDLYGKYNLVLSKIGKIQPNDEVVSHISDAAVDGFVKSLLVDPTLNVYAIPDAIEGAVYRNVIKILLHSLARATDSTGIVLLGHKIRFIIEPLEVSDIKSDPETKK